MQRWLDPAEKQAGEFDDLLVPYPADAIEAYPISKDVNSPKNEGSKLIRRIEPEPTTLFG
jgi:putative SOS response-associated peptidase YedK